MEIGAEPDAQVEEALGRPDTFANEPKPDAVPEPAPEEKTDKVEPLPWPPPARPVPPMWVPKKNPWWKIW
jgi:hypothetical protein